MSIRDENKGPDIGLNYMGKVIEVFIIMILRKNMKYLSSLINIY